MPNPLPASGRLALAALVAAWVVPAWWLGAFTVGGQCFAAGAGAVATAAALAARRTIPAPASDPAARRGGRIALAALGLFVALLVCQALNPDRLFVPDIRFIGTLRPLDHLVWLPTGIASPFDRPARGLLLFGDARRHLLIAAATLLPLAALALLPRRSAILRTLLAALFLHGVLFSTFAFAHNLSGSKAVLWLVTDANFHLGAPQFPFKNQQAAYQILLLAAALAAWWAPAPVRPWAALARRDLWLGLGTGLVFLGSVTTRSRAGLLGTALLVIGAGLLLLRSRPRRHPEHRRLLPSLALVAALALAVLVLLPPVRTTFARLGELAHDPASLVAGGSFRRILHDVAWEMTLDRPWFGHGAGCYLLLFYTYQARVPAYMESIRRDHPDTNRPLHTHADGDWLEFTAEYGLVGTALFATPWLVWLAALRRTRPLAPAVLLLAGGVGFVLAHGWIDFVLRNPAILGLAGTLALLALAIARRAPATTSPA